MKLIGIDDSPTNVI